MGYADGGGDTVNVWRSVSHMEAILQALTYPEIGKIVSTAADFNPDPEVHANDVRFLVQSGVDFIVGYPDVGIALAGAVSEAEAAGVPYLSFSAGYVGLPGQEGALVPGEDYTAVIGEDLCALGESFADVLNTGVGSGEVAMLGGTPGNALTLGWQQCAIAALADGVDLVNPPADENSTTGDTYWVNTMALDAVRGLLTTNPDIKGWAYEYSDGLYTALQAYDELGIPVKNLTVALRTDEQTLFCDWVGARRAHVQHLVLGRRQLPVPSGGHRGDARPPGRRRAGRGRGAPRDEAGHRRRLQPGSGQRGRVGDIPGARQRARRDVRRLSARRSRRSVDGRRTGARAGGRVPPVRCRSRADVRQLRLPRR